MNSNIKPALLTKTEIEWLNGNKQVSKSFEYYMRNQIKNKIKTFMQIELPLLVAAGYINREPSQGGDPGFKGVRDSLSHRTNPGRSTFYVTIDKSPKSIKNPSAKVQTIQVDGKRSRSSL